MEILHAIVLGIVQGLSEFLPISSSGHLELTRWLFGWDALDEDLETAFDVAVHLGTLVGAIKAYALFWRIAAMEVQRIASLAADECRWHQFMEKPKLAALVAVITVLVAVEKATESSYASVCTFGGLLMTPGLGLATGSAVLGAELCWPTHPALRAQDAGEGGPLLSDSQA